jgi:uncharacterized protein YecE (DUF72 family)
MGKSSSRKIAPPSFSSEWGSMPYRVGCPVWACRHWENVVYPLGTSADDILAWYSRSFPTVEGNSTFYSVGAPSLFEKWRDLTPESFRFSFKFPRRISHDLKLVGCDLELKEWLGRLEILYESGRLGPTFLQLAPSFSFRYFRQLAQFIEQLPRDWPWAVELRHADWFDESECEARLNELLERRSIDRVLFDSRPLNALDASDVAEQASQQRKPKSPWRCTVTGRRPMLRLIGRNSLDEVAGYWDQWAQQIVGWIREGYEPWVFTHAPDDTFAPILARAFHQRVMEQLPEIKQLPAISHLIDRAEQESANSGEYSQMRLF